MFLKATSRDPTGVNQDFWGYVAAAVSIALRKDPSKKFEIAVLKNLLIFGDKKMPQTSKIDIKLTPKIDFPSFLLLLPFFLWSVISNPADTNILNLTVNSRKMKN